MDDEARWAVTAEGGRVVNWSGQFEPLGGDQSVGLENRAVGRWTGQWWTGRFQTMEWATATGAVK